MNWSMDFARCAGIRRIAFLLCAIAGNLLIPQAASFAQENAVLVLPKREEELPQKRIGWRFDGITDALTQANTDGKPLVVVFIADPCGWCRIFLTHVLRCDGINTLAGQAHFIIVKDVRDAPGGNSNPGDEEKKQLRRLLEVEAFPTISVVSVKAGTITPVTKFVGVASEASLLDHLAKAGLKTPPDARAGTQQAAVGLPKPAACGATEPQPALEASSPRRLQFGISH